MDNLNRLREQFDAEGFVLLPGLYPEPQLSILRAGLESALCRYCGDSGKAAASGTTAVGKETIHAVRHLLDVWPELATAWRSAPLVDLLQSWLGAQGGLVRALYFDKPPARNWTLPWHKDMTIAVAAARDELGPFSHPTIKEGVPHVEAPESLLESMITARIHLDDATEENGCLRVQPGSHHSGKRTTPTDREQSIVAAAGDVLLMRPLLAHCSGRSAEDSPRHRRILHLEFAPARELPAKYAWRYFSPFAD